MTAQAMPARPASLATAQVRFEIWGTTAHLLVAAPDDHEIDHLGTGADHGTRTDRGTAEAYLDPATTILRAVLRRVDRACNRFVPDSALTRLNAAAGRTVLVDPVLLAAVRTALTAAEQSGGLVDPTVGSSLAALGYDRDLAAIPVDDPAPVRPVPAPGHRTVRVDEALGTVRLLPGTALDLGATAKAWAADLAAAGIADRLGCPVLVNLGGDLAIGGPAPRAGWRVRVTEDHRAGHELPGQVIALRRGGLATSSRTVRTWRRAGRTVHHLVDPRTGTQAPDTWRCVSVAAADCVGANVAATAAMVLGAPALSWLADRRLPARLVAADGTVRTTPGWPRDRTEQEYAA